MLNHHLVWYGRVVWLGILANLALAIPALFVPNWLLGLMSLPAADPPMWPSFAANLLILLSLFYMPAANDPVRHRASAWLTLVSRLAGVIFFIGFHRQYLMFGLLDLTFLIPQSILLFLGLRSL